MKEGTCRKTILENGVRVITEEVSNVRSASVGFWVEAGSRDEEASEQGISHLLEHMLFKGTERRTAQDIARDFDSIGGISNAFTAKEHTCFHARVLNTDLKTANDLLLDMFLHSRFDPEDIELEKSVVLQEIGMVEDTPDEYVHVLFGEMFWNGNPLGRSILGTRETVSKMDRAELLSYVLRAYIPSNVFVAAAGNLKHEELLDHVVEELSTLKVGPGTKESRKPPQLHKVSAHFPKELEQVHICLGMSGPTARDETRFIDTILNILLGGNMSSRLFQEIREKRGLTYSIYSFANTYVDTGMLGVYMGVASESVEEALDLTAAEFRRFRDGDLTEEELKASKRYLKGSILLSSENMDNRMLRLAKNEINFGRYIACEEVERLIDAVTLEDVIEHSKLRLDPANVSITTLGPVAGKAEFPS